MDFLLDGAVRDRKESRITPLTPPERVFPSAEMDRDMDGASVGRKKRISVLDK